MTEPQWPVVFGTGHRPVHLDDLPGTTAQWCQLQAVRCLKQCVAKYGTHTVSSGLALGWDTWLATAALLLHLRLWVHIPSEDQPARWSAQDREWWGMLRTRADQETVYSRDADGRQLTYTQALWARNHGMANTGAAGLALWRPDVATGGTAGMVRYLTQRRVPFVHIDPARQTIEPPGRCVHPVGVTPDTPVV